MLTSALLTGCGEKKTAPTEEPTLDISALPKGQLIYNADKLAVSVDGRGFIHETNTPSSIILMLKFYHIAQIM